MTTIVLDSSFGSSLFLHIEVTVEESDLKDRSSTYLSGDEMSIG